MPVLSELMAEVAPSVSTERSRLTMASGGGERGRAGGEQEGDDGGQAGRDGRDGEGDAGQKEGVERRPTSVADGDGDGQRQLPQS